MTTKTKNAGGLPVASLLIVDNDRVFLDVLSEFFSGEHLCHTAATAEEAIERLGSQDYDVIVTEISMPGMSGEDLLGFVKAHRPRMSVLFVSGSTDEERAERLLTRGAFDYLQKPFPLEEISKRVARAVEHRHRTPPGLNC
jgi:DNA-binding NtrC family response regulator